MIDVRTNAARQRQLVLMERKRLIFERSLQRQMQSIIKKQYAAAARSVESYDFNFNYGIDKYNPDIKKTLKVFYKRVLKNFGEGSLNDLKRLKSYGPKETKSFENDFWNAVTPWIEQNAANKVQNVTKTTRNSIRGIVKREMEAGTSTADIAKQILSIGQIATTYRAIRIALTETHSAANFGQLEAMDASGLIKEKEWLSANDERTRTEPFDHAGANGERVALDDTFKQTGENLDYPGDPDGSPGNIINCRCVQLFHSTVATNNGGNEDE